MSKTPTEANTGHSKVSTSIYAKHQNHYFTFLYVLEQKTQIKCMQFIFLPRIQVIENFTQSAYFEAPRQRGRVE